LIGHRDVFHDLVQPELLGERQRILLRVGAAVL